MKKVSRIGADGSLLYTHTYHERDAAGNVLSESGLLPSNRSLLKTYSSGSTIQ